MLDSYPGEGRDPGRFSKIVHDSNGDLHAAYYETEKADLKYAKGFRDSLTGNLDWDIQTVDFSGDVGQYCDLALVGGLQPVISYHDATNGTMKVAWDANGDGDFEQDGTTFGVDAITGFAEIGTIDGAGPRTGHWTSIAADANDNIHIVYTDDFRGILKFAYYDRVTGSGWSTENVLGGTQADLVGRYTALVVDNRSIGGGRGRDYVFYQNENDVQILYTYWTGTSWVTPSLVVDTQPGGDLFLDAVIASDNSKIYVTYQNAQLPGGGPTDLMLGILPDFGGSFPNANPPAVVFSCSPLGVAPCGGSFVGNWGLHPSITLDRNNLAYIAHYDNTYGNLIVEKRTTDTLNPLSPPEATWQSKRRPATIGDVGTFTSSDQHLYPGAIASLDTIRTSFYDASDTAMRLLTVTNDSVGSETATYVDGAKVGRWSALGIDSIGRSVVAYYDDVDGAVKMTRRSYPTLPFPWEPAYVADDSAASRARSGDILIVEDPKLDRANFSQTGQYVSMAIDDNDDAHLAYYDAFRRELNYSVTDFQTSTTLRYPVDETPERGEYATIARSPFDPPRLAIAYYRADEPSTVPAVEPGLLVALGDSTDPTTWNVETVDETGDVGRYCSIVWDNVFNLHVAYYDSDNFNLKYARRDALSGLWTYFPVATSPTVDGLHTSIAINPATGRPVIAYYDATLASMMFTEQTGPLISQWTVAQEVDSLGDVGQFAEIKFDTFRQLTYLLYYDSVFEGLKAAIKGYIDTNWRIEVIEENGVGIEPSFQIDSQGLIRMTYYDVQNGDLKYRSAEMAPFSSVPGARWTDYE